MIKVEKLNKFFGDNRAVNDVTFEINKPEMIGIIGRSGAGKSTLLRIMNRLTDATSGSIFIEGKDILSLTKKDKRAWQKDCAMIFQQFNLVERIDVLTNVLIGSLGRNYNFLNLIGVFKKKEKINALKNLDRFDLSEKALQKAGTLSGGQQQQVALLAAAHGAAAVRSAALRAAGGGAAPCHAGGITAAAAEQRAGALVHVARPTQPRHGLHDGTQLVAGVQRPEQPAAAAVCALFIAFAYIWSQ